MNIINIIKIGSKISKINKSTLVVSVLCVASIFLWNTILLYPLKLLVVLMHETSHAIAALVTGGSVERIAINVMQGGITYTQGGSRFVILSAGYIGSSLIGALILWASTRKPWKEYLAEVFGLLIIMEAIFWVRDAFTFFFAVAMGAACIFLGTKIKGILEKLFMQLVGTVCCLYAVYDIFSDILSLRILSGQGKNDAQVLAQLTHIPAFIWGAAWIAIAAGIFLCVMKNISKTEE